MNAMGIAQATYQNCCNLFALSAVDFTDAINRVSTDGRLVLYKLRFDDQISECEAPVLPQIDEDNEVMIELRNFMIPGCDVFDVSGFRDTFNDNFLQAIAA